MDPRTIEVAIDGIFGAPHKAAAGCGRQGHIAAIEDHASNAPGVAGILDTCHFIGRRLDASVGIENNAAVCAVV